MNKYLDRYQANRSNKPRWGRSVDEQTAQRRSRAITARAEAAAEYLADIAMDGTDAADS